MNLIRLAIERPIAVMATVLMVILFGLLALTSIPIQLTPDINKPVIGIKTGWTGAAPAEVEREVVNRQEEVLRGLEGLDEMTSSSQDGQGSVTLEFAMDQDMGKALLLVANRLDRVSGYPEEVDEPTLDTAGSEDRPIAWFVLTRLPGNDRPIQTFGDFVEDVVQDRMERVSGVSRVNIHGGSERELQVVVDPERMARYELTVPQVVDALRAANVSVSAGDVEEGKRRYIVRTEGELDSIDQVRSVVLRSDEDPVTGGIARVAMGDISDVRFGYKKATATIRVLGQPAIAFNVVRETGANVIETMDGIRQALRELSQHDLPQAGLEARQVYDETIYIDSAIELVRQNIYVGGILAAIVLLLFLRSGRATLIVSLAIPVSVVGAFVAMAALGRSINVISLAGIAFAVGMVVDAAIVVLENVFRLRQEGRSATEAAYLGARQVWGAILVSALTTVAVFAPVLLMKLEVGQLFRDIAVAISVSVLLSLVVAVTVIPALANRLLVRPIADASRRRLHGIDHFGSVFVAVTLALTRAVIASKTVALVVVVTLCGSTALATWLFLPKLEYLPEGNRNLVLGVIQPPPGYNLATTTKIAEDVENSVRSLFIPKSDPTAGIETDTSDPSQPPRILHFFFVARQASTFVGAAAQDRTRVAELIPILREPVFREPGTFGFITQPSLFGRSIGSGRSIDLNISGPDLEEVMEVAQRASGTMNKLFPRSAGHQFRAQPGLELGAPEVRVHPDPVRLADTGVTGRAFSNTLDAFNDGLRVAEITVGGDRIDLTLKGQIDQVTETQGIDHLPVVTANGRIVPVSSLARVEVTSGPTEIRHLERERTVTLELRPANEMPLETAMDTLRTEIITPMIEAGLPKGVHMRLAGTADNLLETWHELKWDMVIAMAIVYLIMAVLFESFIYPFIIMLSVPLATAGGVAGLALLNLLVYHPLDMLTLLGFVILVGIVVNNAILLVHQTLYHQREDGMPFAEAMLAATRNRIRPIFMSTLTSVVGMLPLVLFPGAGSELYRGLGSVVVGGLSLSAVLTLAIVPALMTLIRPREMQAGAEPTV